MKRINEKELLNVAGGSLKQAAQDSKALYEAHLMNKQHNVFNYMVHWDTLSKELDGAWEKAGIRCISSPGLGDGLSPNQYYDMKTGDKLTHDEALDRLKIYH